MSINELFNELDENLSFDEIKGELMLNDNMIIWSYSLDKHFGNDEDDFDYVDEEDVDIFNFSSESNEEILQNVYKHDLDKIELLIDELEEEQSWFFSEPEIIDDVISFKIYFEK